ncbi:MAG: hypothetical protein MAG794_00173 [Gammaproteobacteria bacterium]|nr:hypothetical protein [Gammaproteobacteria bacterium]
MVADINQFLQKKPRAQQKQKRGDHGPQHPIPDAVRPARAEIQPRDGSHQQRGQQRWVHDTQLPVPQSSQRREEYRVCQIGTHNGCHGQRSIKQQQKRSAQCAGSHRRQGDQGADECPACHGGEKHRPFGKVDVPVLHQPGTQQRYPRRQHQGATQDNGQYTFVLGPLAMPVSQEPQHCTGSRQTAQRHAADDAPLDIAPDLMQHRSNGFGERGIDQIVADGDRWWNSIKNQRRRHQRTAADARQAHQQAYHETRGDEE